MTTRPSLLSRIPNNVFMCRFRWVDCQLVVLHDCVSLPMLEKALASLPSTIGATYELMLSNIKDKFKQAASRAFQWLVLSLEPLTVETFVDILAIDINAEPKFDPDWRMPDPEDILRVYSSLITITSSEQCQKRYVKLAHSSIKDYLLSDTVLIGSATSYAVDSCRSHSDVAMACLYYLQSMINAAKTPSINGIEIQSLCNTYPLAVYAARYWADHLAFAGKSGETSCPLVIELFQPEFFNIWADIWIRTKWNPFFPRYAEVKGNISSLHLAFSTEHSLSRLVEYLLQLGVDPDSRDCHCNTALQIAAKKKDLQTLRILLKCGADPNAPARGHGNRALCLAARGSSDDIVKILLEYGAEINVIPWLVDEIPCFGSPLGCACRGGHLSTVQLLLSKGAHVNIERETGGSTPLAIASAFGDIHIVRLLLAHGATPNSPHRTFSALHHAASGGSVDVAKAFVASGANVDALDERDRTALHWACAMGSRSVAEVLIASGAHLDAISSCSDVPLSNAILHEQTSLVQLLVEKGAEFTMPSRHLIEALNHWAIDQKGIQRDQ